MKYRNVKTGALVDVSSRITGKDWEPVKDTRLPKPENESNGSTKETNSPKTGTAKRTRRK